MGAWKSILQKSDADTAIVTWSVRAERQTQVCLAPEFRLPDIGCVTEFEFQINDE